jgi:outer membrane protein assembly factor BamA
MPSERTFLPAVRPDTTTMILPGAGAPQANDTIKSIRITGNKFTKDRVVQVYLGIAPGSVYDSLKAGYAAQRLRSTGLFLSVKILPLRRPQGVDLVVALLEAPRLSITNLGGELHSRRYGQSDVFWSLWDAHAGLKMANIGGLMESLSLSVQIWEWRSLSIGWSKPFFPTPWSLSTGFSISDYPYEYTAWRHFEVGGKISTSRRLSDIASAYAGGRALYNRVQYYGPADSVNADSSSLFNATWQNADTPLVRSHLHTWTDTVRISPDSIRIVNWNGHATWEKDQNPQNFSEIFLAAGANAGRTNDDYPASRGWSAWAQLGSNIPCVTTSAASFYVQLNTDTRLYHPSFFPGHSVAYRLQTTLRNQDGGKFHRVVAGGTTTVRGYPGGALGPTCEANNSVNASVEYRLPLFRTPDFNIPIAENYYPILKEIFYRFDAGIYADGAYLWHDFDHPLTSSDAGACAGAGLRLLIPPMRRSVCFDVTPLLWNPDARTMQFYWPPAWDLYLDFNF